MKSPQAFPGRAYHTDGVDLMEGPEEGMTLLDHYAGLALQSLIPIVDENTRPHIVAEVAWDYAEAMIKTREQRGHSK